MNAEIARLHRPVQWTGWRLFLQRLGRNPLAFCDKWCRECRKPWPCPTSDALSSTSITTNQEPETAAPETVLAGALIQLDHTDDWVRGFGAEPSEMEAWEWNAAIGAGRELLTALAEAGYTVSLTSAEEGTDV